MLAAIALAAGCADPVSASSDVLIARAAGRDLELANTTTERVYYFAAEREALAVIDWFPCATPSTCPAVEPQSSRRIPLVDVAGYHGGAKVIVVFHWHLVPGNGGQGFRPDSVRSIEVGVR